MTFDAVIVGGGILGASCADALARDGARVAIVEPHQIGGGATAAGMGHIVVIDEPPGEFALSHYSNILWEQLAPELPKSAEYCHPGTIWVAEDEEEMAVVETKNRSYRSVGIPSEPLDAAALARLEPNLRPGLPGGLLVPREPVVYAPVAARYLAGRARAHVIQEAARAVSDNGATLASGRQVAAGAVIVAAGADSGNLVPGLPVRPRKGHLAITDRYPGFLNHQLVELGYIKSAHGNAAEAVAFNLQPRPTGQLLIGSSRQYGVTTSSIDTHMLRRVIRRALHFMPGIAAMSVIRTWTGFRPATPDGMPFIGRWRGNVWLATGHEGLGVTTAPGTAQLLADLMASRVPAIDPTPYLPQRVHHAG